MRIATPGLLLLFGCSSPAVADPGPSRFDLTTLALPIAATIELHGASVHSDRSTDYDARGLTVVVPVAAIDAGGVRMDISPWTAGVTSDRTEDRHDNARFKLLAERVTPTGEWARLCQWHDDDDCFLTGGSTRARLRCHSHALKVSCSATALLDVCTSITPTGAPLPLRSDLAATFPSTSDTLARTVMGAVAVAIVTDDRQAFERYIAPGGLSIRRGSGRRATARTMSARQLHEALAHATVATLTRVTCRDACHWIDIAVGQTKDRVAMSPNTESFGLIGVFRFVRQADRTWKLVAIEDFELGDDH